MGARSALEPAITKYRGLAQRIATRFDTVIANLTDDLRDACTVRGSTRDLIAALLWSFGLIPECHAFQANTAPPSRRLLRRAARYPDYEDIVSRNSHSGFELIERWLSDNMKVHWSERDRCVLVLETLEKFRTGALIYWLRVNPPLLSSASNKKLRALLQNEQLLLERLRGAYFLTLRPILPMHYLWSDVDIEVLLDLEDPARRKWFYSPDAARKEIDEIERDLAKLAERLCLRAPEYAEQRQMPIWVG